MKKKSKAELAKEAHITTYRTAFHAIYPKHEADLLETKSLIFSAICQEVTSWNLKLEDLAKKLKMPIPRVKFIVDGHFSKFNFEQLYTLAHKVGLKVTVKANIRLPVGKVTVKPVRKKKKGV